jgi:hypothetical protein
MMAMVSGNWYDVTLISGEKFTGLFLGLAEDSDPATPSWKFSSKDAQSVRIVKNEEIHGVEHLKTYSTMD